MDSIRNFCIIAHIDHGKSTLADRFLEITKTVETRRMRSQMLDSMELERERGITIKMQPVRMEYSLDGAKYTLNLIDTPGHIDFSYEVSRSLRAVEGALLLVDATQGVQAQTLTVLNQARDTGLIIIPVVSKIDSPLAKKEETAKEIENLLGIEKREICFVSGKTGEGVENLLREIIRRIPLPRSEYKETGSARALIFDFEYSNHRGVILYTRPLDGTFRKGDDAVLLGTSAQFFIQEVGTFSPEKKERNDLSAGEIGYIVTGIKEPGVARIGDTVTFSKKKLPAYPGYAEPKPLVFASIFPESQDDFNALRMALLRLKLSDSSLKFEEEHSSVLGRGFRCGFLGMLHLEIITERLRREFSLELIVTLPSINYDISYKNGKSETIYTPAKFPDDSTYIECKEPWINAVVITPPDYVSALMPILYAYEAEVGESHVFGDSRVSIDFKMPLRELMRNFFDVVKSVSSGYASLSYEIGDSRHAEVTRLDILVAEEIVPAFSKVISTRRVKEEAENAVEKLYKILPQELFLVKIQALARGRIVSSRTLKALKKDVTGYLYGGDVTRKMKLREKQKKGKKKMLARGRVHIGHDIFLKMLK